MDLKAFKNNQNHWKINEDDLLKWASPMGSPYDKTLDAHSAEMVELRTEVQMLTERANAAERARDQAETDRDAWRKQAEELARRSRWWWQK